MSKKKQSAIERRVENPLQPRDFEELQRMSKLLAASAFFPPTMRKSREEAIANAAAIISLAAELGENPISLAQKVYVVGGRVAWYAQHAVARANASGVFRGPITWTEEGEGDDMRATAKAIVAATGEEVSITLSYRDAVEAGWVKGKGGTWGPEAMRRQMLRWRTAAWLVRLYAPQVLAGLYTDVEAETMPDVQEVEEVKAAPAEVVEAPSVPPVPAPEVPETPIHSENEPPAEAGDTEPPAVPEPPEKLPFE